jgi:hypothetical protein
MDALMRMMRQTHHDAMNTSMFDAEAYSPGYRVYIPATRRINTTSVHVKFHKSVPGFTTSHHVDSSIDVFFDADDDSEAPGVPQSTD